VIIGSEATQAVKRSSGISEEIHNQSERLGITRNIFMVGSVSDETLSGALFGAEVLVFPVLNLPDDVEGFGMVAIEAAAHGTPTLGFAVGGITDAISNQESGWLVESGNYEAMLNIINCTLSNDSITINENSCLHFAKKNGWDVFAIRLNKILNEKFH
jgi:phosphatidylinositol alpha-1,6-mannosyltransferase